MASHSRDPALEAAEALRLAEQTFLRQPARTIIDELSSPYVQAETRWREAEIEFADAVPTSAAGVLAKLSALASMLDAMSASPDCLEVRHVQSLLAHFRKVAVSADAVTHLPTMSAAGRRPC
jgi:hypothetical protein